MIQLLRQRNYALLWWSQLISMMGDWALFAALPFYVYELTGSVLATGTMFMVQLVPHLLLGSVAGVFVDRWDRRLTMIATNLLRGLLLLGLVAVRSPEWVWVVYAVAFLEALGGLFFGPANNALLPRLVGEEQLLTANALDALGENGARLLGPAVGGALLAMVGLGGVVLLDVGSYLVAALMLALIVVPPPEKREGGALPAGTGAAWAEVWREWLAGLRFIAGSRPLAALLMVNGIALLGDSILTVLLVAFFQDVLLVGSTEFGWVLAARGLGGILGGLVVGRFGRRFRPERLIALGALGSGLALAVILQWPLLPVALVGVILAGLPIMAWLISSQTWLQAQTTDRYRGRVFGAYGTTVALMMLMGMAFASATGDRLGIVFTLSIGAALYVLAGALGLVLLPATANAPSSYSDGLPPEPDRAEPGGK